ncbi:Tim44/TimA family putative adaptor protein [Sandaracinobacteroides saxicola]|uniref:Tim44 domain-containing protein n=1 Tax=Sandaracinobacteroides saxicola TaxID=2759707 RepID=A0A7G5IM10_9SPHN|nr:Tim44/TimA family putative adaptor protein [Sandaracinobacteroides saxicola]QMW24402.1 Tim44 domain-containing protein [Sandaracinobacteroides saxicola]
MDNSGWIEIIFLAMLAGFIGLRLYNVLGRRTGNEKPAADAFRPTGPELARPGARPEPEAPLALEVPAGTADDVRSGLEAIARADRNFNPDGFLVGARGAYSLILEAFWRGDMDAMDGLVADDVAAQFRAAIATRDDPVDNKLLAIDNARIVEARMNGTMAEVTVQFDADISMGSERTSVQAHDLWTFSRLTSSSDPAWLLIATDDTVGE